VCTLERLSACYCIDYFCAVLVLHRLGATGLGLLSAPVALTGVAVGGTVYAVHSYASYIWPPVVDTKDPKDA
jgi:hypothetical protein